MPFISHFLCLSLTPCHLSLKCKGKFIIGLTFPCGKCTSPGGRGYSPILFFFGAGLTPKLSRELVDQSSRQGGWSDSHWSGFRQIAWQQSIHMSPPSHYLSASRHSNRTRKLLYLLLVNSTTKCDVKVLELFPYLLWVELCPLKMIC